MKNQWIAGSKGTFTARANIGGNRNTREWVWDFLRQTWGGGRGGKHFAESLLVILQTLFSPISLHAFRQTLKIMKLKGNHMGLGFYLELLISRVILFRRTHMRTYFRSDRRRTSLQALQVCLWAGVRAKGRFILEASATADQACLHWRWVILNEVCY